MTSDVDLPLLVAGNDRTAIWSAALAAAVQMHAAISMPQLEPGVCADEPIRRAEDRIRSTALVFAALIEGPIEVLIVPGPVFDEATGQPTTATQEGDKMQINTGQGLFFQVKGRDRSGYKFVIPDVEVTTDNPAVTVLSRVEETPGRWRVGTGDPGESILTVELPPLQEGGEPRTARLVVDVVPGDAEVLEFEIGEIFEEDVPPPAPAE